MNRSLNSLCSCGSGKKYKRCCGVSATVCQTVGKQESRQLIEMGYRYPQLRGLKCATSVYPKTSEALGMRGMTAFAQNNYQEAQGWLAMAIQENPDDARLYHLMGQVMASQGDAIEAEHAFLKAVTLDPGFFEGWCNLGLVFKKSNRLLEAISAFNTAIRLSPNDAELYLSLTETYYLLGDIDKAEGAARKALDGGVGVGRGNIWLSLVLRAKGASEESLEAEALAVDGTQNFAEIFDLLLKFGKTDVLVGKLNQAEYWLTRAMRLIPDNPEPYIQLAVSKKFTVADLQLVGKMESFSDNSKPYAKRLGFALGKVYDDLEDHARSFEHYRRANDIVREKMKFEPAELVANITKIIEAFSSERMARLPRGSDSNLPVLIVGTPRSGTTLVEQIISSHSKVVGAGELAFWGKIGGPVADDMSGRYNDNVARELASAYMKLLRDSSPDAQQITDKMPGNFALLGLIHAVFPNSKVVHCRRHPIDACLSMYFQNFNENHRYKFSLEGLATFYEQYVRLMEHWKKVLPARVIYEVQYEDLIDDSHGESRKIMEFLGLDWQEEQMDFFKKECPIFTCSKWQVRQPIYKSSRERWRHYARFIEPLLPLLKYARANQN